MTIETCYGKITASKETLNSLSLLMSEASKSYINRDRIILGCEASNEAGKIYEALRSVGYYD